MGDHVASLLYWMGNNVNVYFVVVLDGDMLLLLQLAGAWGCGEVAHCCLQDKVVDSESSSIGNGILYTIMNTFK